MEEKKQTAIDYLLSAVYRTVELNPYEHLRLNDAVEKAKEVEKKQIMDAFWEGGQWVPCHYSTCEKYYAETYGEDELPTEITTK